MPSTLSRMLRAFLQRSTVLTQFLDQQVNQEGVVTRSARNDVDNIPTNKLLRSDYAVISNNQKLRNVLPIRSDDSNNPEIALFIDGIRYVLTDWNTFQYLAQYRNKPPWYGVVRIPAAAYNAIPEYALPEGIRIVPGQLYRSDLESQYTVYWASDDQTFTLCPLTRPYYDRIFPNRPWTEIPDAFLQCLRKGGKDRRDPNTHILQANSIEGRPTGAGAPSIRTEALSRARFSSRCARTAGFDARVGL